MMKNCTSHLKRTPNLADHVHRSFEPCILRSLNCYRVPKRSRRQPHWLSQQSPISSRYATGSSCDESVQSRRPQQELTLGLETTWPMRSEACVVVTSCGLVVWCSWVYEVSWLLVGGLVHARMRQARAVRGGGVTQRWDGCISRCSTDGLGCLGRCAVVSNLFWIDARGSLPQ